MKVYATIQSPYRATTGGALKFHVDYFFCTGPLRNDTVALTVSAPHAIGNEGQLRYAMKVLLVAHLNATFAPEVFSVMDVVGLGA